MLPTMTRIAAYAGSFDPPTWGHFNVVSKVAKLFDTIHLVVAHNIRKTSLFDAEEKKKLLLECQRQGFLPSNCQIHVYEGLIVNFCEQYKVDFLVRGLRAVSDYENELQIATMNKKLKNDLETLLVMADEKYFFVSSSLVKEVAFHGAALDDLVPPPIAKALTQKFSMKEKTK